MPIKRPNIFKIQKEYNAFKKRLPGFVGGLAVTFFKENFRRGGFVNERLEPWKPTKKGSPFAKPKGSVGRNVLIRSGTLLRSIKVLRKTNRVVKVGSANVPYANIHNEGGTITQKPTKKQRKFFWAMYKQTGDRAWKSAALADTITIKIPKRQFVGKSKALDRLIFRQIEARLIEILTGN